MAKSPVTLMGSSSGTTDLAGAVTPGCPWETVGATGVATGVGSGTAVAVGVGVAEGAAVCVTVGVGEGTLIGGVSKGVGTGDSLAAVATVGVGEPGGGVADGATVDG